MAKRILFIFLIVMAQLVYAGERGILDGVLKPEMIRVYDGKLYVTEQQTFYIFSLKDLSLLKKVGNSGEGPGEFIADPNRTISLSVYPQHILTESRYKLIYFSHDGTFIKEKRKPSASFNQVLPLGDNFVAMRWSQREDDKQHNTVGIYDGEFELIKELYTQRNFSYRRTAQMIPDALNFCVAGDKLFIEKSPEGFIVDVFDTKGNVLYRIENEYDKLSIGEAHRTAALDAFKEIPFIKRRINQTGGEWFKTYKSRNKILYRDTFPAIRDIMTDGKRLFLKTYKTKQSSEEYISMDFKGKILKKILLPKVRKAAFLVQMQGNKKYYCIHGGMFYYLKLVETEDDADWVLYTANIPEK
ncbi:MAG: 6-bladed beta-propeller [bacterium]|nr:6-bladed beta-propeller [bacterium]